MDLPMYISMPLTTSLSKLTYDRRRHAHVNQPNQMASDRRRPRYPTWLVPRTFECLDVYQPRSRHRAKKLFAADANGFRYRRAVKYIVQWKCLYTAGAAAGELHCENRGQCDDSGHRDGAAWSGPV